MSPVNGLTVNPNNLVADQHLSAGSHGVLEGWGFSRAVGVSTSLSSKAVFYRSATRPLVHFWHRQECLCYLDCEKMRYEYEGESHDVIDNTGQVFLSHDVNDG
jgi:hypothetical protein